MPKIRTPSPQACGIVDAGWTQSRAMKLLDSNRKRRALTLIDVLIVIATVALAAAVLLVGGLIRQPVRGPRINCVNNLRQVGIAFRMWANDHGEQFPRNVAQSNGGTMEFAMSTE